MITEHTSPSDRVTASLTLTESEGATLAWLAARYDSAGFIWAHVDAIDADDDELGIWAGTAYVGRFTPAMLAAYCQLLTDDNNNPAQDVPPCAGGSLAAKLRLLIGTEECPRRAALDFAARMARRGWADA